MLGFIPKDYDFTTRHNPDEIETLVRAAGKRAYVTGKRFGTIGFKVDGQMVEVTTFRSERYTGASRKPEVEYVTNLYKDLARRDFTFNAMARGLDGELIDPHGGRYDLRSKFVRTVGNPTIRFKEDPLRLLRAARFSA